MVDSTAFFDKPKMTSTAAFRWLDMPSGGRLRCWRKEPVKFPKFTVVILPGRGEFAEKYESVAEEFNKREGRVLGIDWPGQGKSSRTLRNPQRGHITSYEQYVDAMKLFMNSMVRFATEGKLFFLAHSMGALIALHYLAKHPANLEGLIFTSPMVDFYTEPFNRRLSQAMANFACNAEFAEAYAFSQGDYGLANKIFERNPFTGNKKTFDKNHAWLEQEPQMRLGGPTFGWLKASFQAIEELPKMNISTLSGADKLILSSPDDRIVPFTAQQKLSAHLSKCTLEAFNGTGHDILMETDELLQKKIWPVIDKFMAVRIPNYRGGGTDRIKPDSRVLLTPKPPPFRPGSGRF